jgi:hypothetical protein
MLERAHHFLTEKAPPEVEAAAERFFPALGYRRRGEAESPGKIVFARGRPLASFYAASLRACRTIVEVAAKPGQIQITHRVTTRGRLVGREDHALLAAEARGFERFLERGDPDAAALLEAAARAAGGAVAWKVALVLLIGAAAFAATVLFAGRR